MKTLDKVYQHIKQTGVRITPHMRLVLNTIISYQEPIDAKYIYDKIQDNTSINLSTIHRILDKLHYVQILDIVYGEKSALYELSSQFIPHHHHFTCIQCHRIIDIDICMMKPILESITSIGTPISHSFEIQGICTQCQPM